MTLSNYHGIGGHGSTISNLCVGLDKLGFETTIGAFSFIQSPDEVNILKLKKFRSLTNRNFGKEFDIIHNHHSKMNFYSLLTEKPFIFHIHGARGIIQNLILRSSVFLCQKKISRVIGVSNEVLNQLGVMRDKLQCDAVYTGVDTTFYNTNLPRPYVKGDPQLLFVGILFPNKNLGRMIEIMTSILKIFPNAHFQIVGDGIEYRNLEEKIKKLKLENNVELVGRISKEELRLRYSSCDFYVSACIHDMYNLPLVEAMACGKPGFISDIAVHKELADASNACSIFSPSENSDDIAKKFEELYQNRNNLSQLARKFAKEQDWPAVCKKVASIYEQVLQ